MCNRLYNLEETMLKLGGISRATIYRLVNSKKLPAKKVNRRTMFTEEAINNYIDTLENYEGSQNGF